MDLHGGPDDIAFWSEVRAFLDESLLQKLPEKVHLGRQLTAASRRPLIANLYFTRAWLRLILIRWPCRDSRRYQMPDLDPGFRLNP